MEKFVIRTREKAIKVTTYIVDANSEKEAMSRFYETPKDERECHDQYIEEGDKESIEVFPYVNDDHD